jgi:predicted NBD/HSP70 family sugar kinase
MIFQRAWGGEQRAETLVDELCSAIAVGCINLSRMTSVPLVVLTGGVAEAGERLISRVNEHIARRSWKIAPPMSRAVGAGVGGAMAGVIGAAAMARQGL